MNPEATDVGPDAILGQSHDLDHEFPEFKGRIHELIERDDDFAKMCDTYTNLNREIIRIEQGLDARSNGYFEDAKKLRLLQKDMIYSRLRE